MSSRPHEKPTPKGDSQQPLRLDDDAARKRRREEARRKRELMARISCMGVAVGVAFVIALAHAAGASAAGASKQLAAENAKYTEVGRAGTGRHVHVEHRKSRSTRDRIARSKLSDQQDALTKQSDKLSAKLAEVGIARDDALAAENAAIAVYQEHLVSLYRSSQPDRLAAIIASRSVGDVVQSAELAVQVEQHDQKLIDTLHAATERVDALAAQTADVSSQLVAVNAQLDGVNSELVSYDSGTVIHDPNPADADGIVADASMFYTTTPLTLFGTSVTLPGTPTSVPAIPPAAMPDGYVPTGATEDGDASWYGPGFDGKTAADGETYDQEALTAAHRTLPFGTWIKVTNTTNGQSVFVRINDRGPYVDGRLVDLSHAGAQAIGLDGVASVHIEVYGPPA